MLSSGLRALAAFVIVALLTPVVAVVVILGASIFLPLPATLPTATPGRESRVSRVLDAAGTEIASFREFETSIPVQPADVPQVLKDAVVAVEDRNFYDHGGIDVRAAIRALFADVRSGEIVQGGSTITQQYVRNVFEEVGTEQSLGRKIREAILAAQIDRQMSKDEILFDYLSRIYFGEGAYGVGAAAETYFRKPVSELTLSESALLASVIPAPSVYSPRVDPATAEQRRKATLDVMLEERLIFPRQHSEAMAETVWLMANGEPPGLATRVFPPRAQESAEPWFTDYVRVWLQQNLPGCSSQSCDILYQGGLQIETTLDPRIQAMAREEILAQVDGNDPSLQMAIASVEPPTGFVRALVGGRDYAVSQVNTALGELGGGVDRQPGSAFKPFVLAAAFEVGIAPTATYSGSPCETPDGQVIENYGGARFGTLSLRAATESSVNAVYCRLILDVGVEETMEMASRLGLSMPAYDPSVYGASVALGAVGASPLEMASAFGVFANGGRRAAPTPVLRVTDADGNVLIDNTGAADAADQVIGPDIADNVTDVLRGVLTDGTAADNGIDRPAAGKTGTTDDNFNAWFVGYTPTLSSAVWMGYLDVERPLQNINGVRNVDGGTLPAATWQTYMTRALEGVPVTEFNQPVPIADQADAALRRQRGGFGPGPQLVPAEPPGGGPREIVVAPPVAQLPTSTTEPEPTTTTTRPGATPPFTLFPRPTIPTTPTTGP